MQLAHLLMVDSDKPHPTQTVTLHAVVNDITKTIEGGARSQFLLSFLDSSGHSKAKAATVVNLNLKHIFCFF